MDDKPPPEVVEEMDQNIAPLARALNAFEGITTTDSCGGHHNPKPYQAEGTWGVTFVVDHTEDGWYALEFLSWLANNAAPRGGMRVALKPFSPPPWLNCPGRCLIFGLDGFGGVDPAEFAALMDKEREANYHTPAATRAQEQEDARHALDDNHDEETHR